MTKIAYQGGPGAYSTIAARNYFGDSASLEFSGHDTFAEALDGVLKGACNYAIIPVENSTTGFIQDYPKDLFREVGDIVVAIHHCLLGMQSSELNSVERIYSHPQALAQCRGFLQSSSRFKPTEYTDTALAAQKIFEDQNPTQAAIASAEAGSLYGLKILAEDIADKPNNKTRFVILQRKQP